MFGQYHEGHEAPFGLPEVGNAAMTYVKRKN